MRPRTRFYANAPFVQSFQADRRLGKGPNPSYPSVPRTAHAAAIGGPPSRTAHRHGFAQPRIYSRRSSRGGSWHGIEIGSQASSAAATGAADELAASRLRFALSRYDEGERSVALLGREYPELMARPGLTVLDLGSGNGGMLFPFGEHAGARLVALDVYLDQQLAAFRRAAGLSVLHLLGTGAALPLAARSVDVVIMAEVL